MNVDKIRQMPYTIEHNDGTKTVYDLAVPQEARAFANVMRSVIVGLNQELLELQNSNAALQNALSQKDVGWRGAAIVLGAFAVLTVCRFLLFK